MKSPAGIALLIMMTARIVSAARYTVIAAPPRISTIPNVALLREFCDRPDVEGCTQIIGAALRCDCVEDGSIWRAHIVASFVPYIFVARQSRWVIHHEVSHIRDIHHMMTSYAARLSDTAFPSPAACDVQARRIEAGFEDQIQSFARASQRRLR